MSKKKALIIAGLAGATVLLGQSPALAHDHMISVASCTPNPPFPDKCLGGGHGGTNNGHQGIKVCDDQPDNWGVRVHAYLSNGSWRTVGDGNGSADGCGGRSVAPYRVRFFKVCSGENGVDSVCAPADRWETA